MLSALLNKTFPSFLSLTHTHGCRIFIFTWGGEGGSKGRQHPILECWGGLLYSIPPPLDAPLTSHLNPIHHFNTNPIFSSNTGRKPNPDSKPKLILILNLNLILILKFKTGMVRVETLKKTYDREHVLAFRK